MLITLNALRNIYGASSQPTEVKTPQEKKPKRKSGSKRKSDTKRKSDSRSNIIVPHVHKLASEAEIKMLQHKQEGQVEDQKENSTTSSHKRNSQKSSTVSGIPKKGEKQDRVLSSGNIKAPDTPKKTQNPGNKRNSATISLALTKMDSISSSDNNDNNNNNGNNNYNENNNYTPTKSPRTQEDAPNLASTSEAKKDQEKYTPVSTTKQRVGRLVSVMSRTTLFAVVAITALSSQLLFANDLLVL